MFDADLDRPTDRPRQFLRPLDRQDAFQSELFESQLIDLARIVEAVQIHMNERDAAAPILLHQRERRAAHFFRRDFQPFREPANQRRLARAEIADQQDDGAGRERCRQPAPTPLVSASECVVIVD